MTTERDRAMEHALAGLTESLTESLTGVHQLATEVGNGGVTAVLTAVTELLTHALIDAHAVAALCGEAATEVGQLQAALDKRVVIEQAKGVLAERAGITTDVAWLRLRHYARNHNRRAAEVATALVDGTMSVMDVATLMEPLP